MLLSMHSTPKLLPTTVLLLLLAQPLAAQVSRGLVEEGLEIHSRILDKPVRYTVYLPYDYESSHRYYPVVYLLHGFTDNDMGWIQFGEAHQICDEGIAAREIPAMILIMPDGGLDWYVNSHDGSVRYLDFFFEELMPHVESKYRIRQERRYRATAGLSMGGYGALRFALERPDLFSGCIAFSAGVHTLESIRKQPMENWNRVFGRPFGRDLSPEERVTEHLLANNIFHILEQIEPSALNRMRLYIDCGDDDFLSADNARLHALLKDKGIDHQYRMRDGAHNWTYWRTGLLDALKFIGGSFHQE